MANRIRLQLPQRQEDDSWNPEIALAEALAERAEFLRKNPQYWKFQNEIDRLLDKAGSSENRMIVLAMLMEGKLIDLHRRLRQLNAIMLSAGAKPALRSYLN